MSYFSCLPYYGYYSDGRKASSGSVPVPEPDWHLDASDPNNIQLTGNNVDSWLDTGPGLYHATQGVQSEQPPYIEGVNNTKNGVYFDGLTKNLSTTAFDNGTNLTTFSILRLSIKDANVWGRSILCFFGGNTYFLEHVNQTWRVRTFNPGLGQNKIILSSNLTVGALVLITTIYDRFQNNFILRINGVQAGSETPTWDVGGTADIKCVSRENTAAFLCMQGYQSENILYKRVLEQAEIDAVESSLISKYYLNVLLNTTNLVCNLDSFFYDESAGSFVDPWNDKSGNSNNATQTTPTNQPGFVKNNTVSNTPSIQMNGTDQWMSLPNLFDPNADDFTVMIAAKINGNSAVGDFVNMLNQGGANGQIQIYCDTVNKAVLSSMGGITTSSAINTFEIDQWYVFTITWSHTTGIVTLFLDTTQIATQTVGPVASETAGFFIGKNAANSQYFNGEYACVLVDKTVLNQNQIENNVNYLKIRYNFLPTLLAMGGNELLTPEPDIPLQ